MAELVVTLEPKKKFRKLIASVVPLRYIVPKVGHLMVSESGYAHLFISFFNFTCWNLPTATTNLIKIVSHIAYALSAALEHWHTTKPATLFS